MDEIKEEEEFSSQDQVKKLISIGSEHLLNVTLTKSTIHLFEQIQTMFNESYQHNSSSDDDLQQSLLTIHNLTGQHIRIEQLIGVDVFIPLSLPPLSFSHLVSQ